MRECHDVLCSVFKPAFGCCAHPKAGQNTLLSCFQPFLFILTFFSDFMSQIKKKRLKWTKKCYFPFLPTLQSWPTCKHWSTPWEGTSIFYVFLVDFLQKLKKHCFFVQYQNTSSLGVIYLLLKLYPFTTIKTNSVSYKNYNCLWSQPLHLGKNFTLLFCKLCFNRVEKCCLKTLFQDLFSTGKKQNKSTQ